MKGPFGWNFFGYSSTKGLGCQQKLQLKATFSLHKYYSYFPLLFLTVRANFHEFTHHATD
jgi:hypothetical protein